MAKFLHQLIKYTLSLRTIGLLSEDIAGLPSHYKI